MTMTWQFSPLFNVVCGRSQLTRRLTVNTDDDVGLTHRVPGEVKRREVELDPQVSPEEIMSREVELDPQVSPEEIVSREVELAGESWTSFAASGCSPIAVQRTLSYLGLFAYLGCPS